MLLTLVRIVSTEIREMFLTNLHLKLNFHLPVEWRSHAWLTFEGVCVLGNGFDSLYLSWSPCNWVIQVPPYLPLSPIRLLYCCCFSPLPADFRSNYRGNCVCVCNFFSPRVVSWNIPLDGMCDIITSNLRQSVILASRALFSPSLPHSSNGPLVSYLSSSWPPSLSAVDGMCRRR